MSEIQNDTTPVEVTASTKPALTAEQIEAKKKIEEASLNVVFQVYTPPPASTTVQQDAIVYEKTANWDPAKEVLALPPETYERTKEITMAFPNVRNHDTTAGREWEYYLKSSIETIQYKDQFAQTTERDGATFRQAVPSERGPLTAAAPSFKDTENIKLTGERAVLRVRSLLNMGSIVQIPLWHSGFWLSLKAPADGELLELDRRLGEQKISLGRVTHGLAYSNDSVFTTGLVMDFALSNFYDCTLKDNSLSNVRSKISTLDIPIIAWGLACVIWPRGFQYARSVLDGTANKVIKEKLNVGKLLWTDTSSLTPWQIAHMANRGGNTMTDDAIKRYRDEFTRGQGRTIDVGPDLKIAIRVPSMDQYLTSGYKWVNNIVSMVDAAFSAPANADDRNTHIYNHGRATFMRQYAHWVESIIVGENNTIDDVETIDQTLDILSSDDDIRKAFIEGVRKYMEDATVSLVAVPAVNENEESGLPRFPHLLPLDAVNTFFTLLVQKVARIQERDQD